MTSTAGSIQAMLDTMSNIGVSGYDTEHTNKFNLLFNISEAKKSKPYMDILGAIKAVNTFTPAAKAIKEFNLTLAQADDLYAHLEGCERLVLGRWPSLTMAEAKSLYGKDYADWRRETLRRLKRCKGNIKRPTPETLDDLMHIHVPPPKEYRLKMRIPGLDDKRKRKIMDAVMGKLSLHRELLAILHKAKGRSKTKVKGQGLPKAKVKGR